MHLHSTSLTGTFWSGRRVFITGHTGFKGVWLSLWLTSLGARVFGYSRHSSAGPVPGVSWYSGDIADFRVLEAAMRSAAPEFVFHMAAQPLVRRAFQAPLETYQANILGTAALLESIRHIPSVRAVLIVTTDRCYQDKGWNWAYREQDPLGGDDPYSSSKACMELVAQAFRNSFFSGDRIVGVATARAGNMLGGGDWAQDRLIPDMMRSFAAGSPVVLRNPRATRPWQFVLEALRGYLLLAEALERDPRGFSGAWNFGPGAQDIRPVEWIATELTRAWGAGAAWQLAPDALPQESQMMRLDCSQAAARLGWSPVLSLAEALRFTVDWYRAHYAGADTLALSRAQITAYSELAGIEAPALAQVR